MEAIIAWLLAEAWPYILGVLALVGGWLAARQSGKSAGRREVEDQQREADASAREKAREAAVEIERLDDDAVRDRARERMRRAQGR